MNQERWLVSYADFITLLFAFFVVMFASSQVDKKKMAMMAASFNSYLNSGRGPTRGPQQPATNPSLEKEQSKASGFAGQFNNPGTAVKALTMAELRPSMEKLEIQLLEEIAGGKLELSLQPRGLVMSLKESAFFAPGQDQVSTAARPILAKVAEGLKQIPGQIRLEGHTDNTPIRTPRFPSNWQLSTARSVAVLKLLTSGLAMPTERFAVAGYGEFHPLEPNNTGPGRARNRRVDLVILTQAAAEMAPPTSLAETAGRAK